MRSNAYSTRWVVWDSCNRSILSVAKEIWKRATGDHPHTTVVLDDGNGVMVSIGQYRVTIRMDGASAAEDPDERASIEVCDTVTGTHNYFIADDSSSDTPIADAAYYLHKMIFGRGPHTE